MNESNPVTRYEMQVYFNDGRALVMCDNLEDLFTYVFQWTDILDYVRIVPIKISSVVENNNNKISNKKSFFK